MKTITPEILIAAGKYPQDDWREFYNESGAEMLVLAHRLLFSKDKKYIELGLQIIGLSMKS